MSAPFEFIRLRLAGFWLLIMLLSSNRQELRSLGVEDERGSCVTSLATPSLLARIAIWKHLNGVPLHRLEDTWMHDGVSINLGTMSRWLADVGALLQRDGGAPALSTRRWLSGRAAVPRGRRSALDGHGGITTR